MDAAAARRSLKELYEAHAPAVREFARRLTGDTMSAEDLVHDVFAALARGLAPASLKVSVRSYLFSIAVNKARQHVRAATRRRRAMQRVAREPAQGPATPDEERRRSELAEALTRAMDELSLRHRTAFVLYEVEGLSAAEVASALGIPEATVRTRVFHARARLRAALAKDGFR